MWYVCDTSAVQLLKKLRFRNFTVLSLNQVLIFLSLNQVLIFNFTVLIKLNKTARQLISAMMSFASQTINLSSAHITSGLIQLDINL